MRSKFITYNPIDGDWDIWFKLFLLENPEHPENHVFETKRYFGDILIQRLARSHKGYKTGHILYHDVLRSDARKFLRGEIKYNG